PTISVGRTRAGISGSGGPEAATCGDGVVLQADTANADSAAATSDQPKLRLRIDTIPYFCPPHRGASAKDPPTLSTAWLTRWNRANPVRPRSRDFGRKVGPCQGRCESAGLRHWPLAPSARRRAWACAHRRSGGALRRSPSAPPGPATRRAGAVAPLVLLACVSPRAAAPALGRSS